MLEKYRHPVLGRFEKLKLAKNSGVLGTVLVSEAELNQLLGYLNEGKTPEQKRILAILEQIQVLGNIKPPVFHEEIDGPMMVGALPNPAFENVAPEKYWLQMEIERRKTALNTELAKYRFTPYVFTGAGANQLNVVWQPDWRGETESEKLPDRLIEGQNLELILNLARARCLDRLRRCGQCKKWLYARFSHQNFCSMKCQQKIYTQSEEWKEHRRKYMREYYRLTQARPSKGKSRR